MTALADGDQLEAATAGTAGRRDGQRAVDPIGGWLASVHIAPERIDRRNGLTTGEPEARTAVVVDDRVGRAVDLDHRRRVGRAATPELGGRHRPDRGEHIGLAGQREGHHPFPQQPAVVVVVFHDLETPSG